MQTNQMCLILIDKNFFNDLVRVAKGHTPYIEIGDNLGFLAVCYFDSGVEREDEGEVSIDTQPAASVDTPASP